MARKKGRAEYSRPLGVTQADATLRARAANTQKEPLMSNDDHFLDLTGDNVMPTLLEERESLKALIDNANHRLLELNNNIKAKLGDAQFATLPGWSIVYRSYKRREYVTKEAYLRPLYIKRATDDE